MTLDDLKAKLQQLNIPGDAYSFEQEYPNEAYCLNCFNGVWQVYYSERGEKNGLKKFSAENEACRYLLELIRKEALGSNH